jgi:hypothetical protein
MLLLNLKPTDSISLKIPVKVRVLVAKKAKARPIKIAMTIPIIDI